MTTVEVFAPAKINLTLHVTGRRDDGYHLLDSLVTFGPMGDRLVLRDGESPLLAVQGDEAAGVPDGPDNLVVRAVRAVSGGREVAMTLTKELPAASGIGGGSADAAAAVRGAFVLWNDVPAVDLMAFGPGILTGSRAAALAGLGADVPMCLGSRTCRVRGIGEDIERLDLPPLPAVLVNPRVPLPTPAVFRALARADNPPMPESIPEFADAAALIRWLATCRNDLETPAKSIAPVIGGVLDALAGLEGAALVRMSGSGATCFALFEEAEAAEEAANRIGADRPDWWVAGGVLGDQWARAVPRVV